MAPSGLCLAGRGGTLRDVPSGKGFRDGPLVQLHLSRCAGDHSYLVFAGMAFAGMALKLR